MSAETPGFWKRRLAYIGVSWFLVFVVVAVALYGRFDWTTQPRVVLDERDLFRMSRFSKFDFEISPSLIPRRAFLLSLCLQLILLPTCYYGMRFTLGRRSALIATTVLGLIGCFPYHALGIDRGSFFQIDRRFVHWAQPGAPEATIRWFPEVLNHLPSVPGELPLFLLLLVGGSAVLAWSFAGGLSRQRILKSRGACVMIGAWVLIVLQSWMHLSMLSPYSYMSRFQNLPAKESISEVTLLDGSKGVAYEQIPTPHTWHHAYLLDGGRGIVNADYRVFRAIEELFQANPRAVDTEIVRRSLIPYIASQFTLFVNPFYVYLVLNMLLWLWAARCFYLLGAAWFDERVASFATLLLATGSGFIFFVAQPMSYLGGYAAQIILTWLFEIWVVRPRERALGPWLAFSGALTLGMLTTDFFPFFSFMIAHALLRGVTWWKWVFAIVVPGVLYAGYNVLLNSEIGQPLSVVNSRMITSPWKTMLDLLISWDTNRIYTLTLGTLNHFAMNLFHAFLVLPLIPALLGIGFIGDRRKLLSVLSLFLPALGLICFLHFGAADFAGWPMSALPRLAYIAYPGMYLLAAVALARFSDSALSRRLAMVRGLPILFMILLIAWNSFDVFGAPALYYYFYFGLNLTGLHPFGLP